MVYSDVFRQMMDTTPSDSISAARWRRSSRGRRALHSASFSMAYTSRAVLQYWMQLLSHVISLQLPGVRPSLRSSRDMVKRAFADFPHPPIVSTTPSEMTTSSTSSGVSLAASSTTNATDVFTSVPMGLPMSPMGMPAMTLPMSMSMDMPPMSIGVQGIMPMDMRPDSKSMAMTNVDVLVKNMKSMSVVPPLPLPVPSRRYRHQEYHQQPAIIPRNTQAAVFPVLSQSTPYRQLPGTDHASIEWQSLMDALYQCKVNLHSLCYLSPSLSKEDDNKQALLQLSCITWILEHEWQPLKHRISEFLALYNGTLIEVSQSL
jgi:hypothetical protein